MKVALQDLSRNYQSGGEKGLPTVIYITLQELTSVPLRFVDIINQGMDLFKMQKQE